MHPRLSLIKVNVEGMFDRVAHINCLKEIFSIVINVCAHKTTEFMSYTI